MQPKTLTNEFVEFGTGVFKKFGMDTLSAKLVMLIYLEPKEISMEKLKDITGYSLASISNKIKLLEKIGFIQKVKKPGTKKIYLFMDKDMTKIMRRKVEMANETEIRPAKQILPGLIEKYKDKQTTKRDKEQYKIIKGYYSQILKFEEIIKTVNKMLDDIQNET